VENSFLRNTDHIQDTKKEEVIKRRGRAKKGTAVEEKIFSGGLRDSKLSSI